MSRKPRRSSHRPQPAPTTNFDSAAGPHQFVVRCGVMRTLGVLTSPSRHRYGDEVIAETLRGTEFATVLCEATPATADAMEVEPTQGQILRTATDNDRQMWQRIVEQTDQDIQICERIVAAAQLEMDLVEVERIFGGEKLVVYYIAPQRVDFRSLVRDLAKQFRTRIEMKQIGVRDEAKLLADYGDCGQPICCSRFLSKMPPVSMKMAKIQKATLDPTKISGRCGRLKCCLRYEYDNYRESAEELPPVGSLVTTRDGNVSVTDVDLLSGMLVVRTEDKRRITIPGTDVLSVLRRGDVQKRRRPSPPNDKP